MESRRGEAPSSPTHTFLHHLFGFFVCWWSGTLVFHTATTNVGVFTLLVSHNSWEKKVRASLDIASSYFTLAGLAFRRLAPHCLPVKTCGLLPSPPSTAHTAGGWLCLAGLLTRLAVALRDSFANDHRQEQPGDDGRSRGEGAPWTRLEMG